MQTMNANSQNEIPVWFMDGSQTLLSNSLPSRMNEWKKFDVWSLACCLTGCRLGDEVWGVEVDHESQSATRLIVWGWPGPTPEMRREEERCPGPGPGPVLSCPLSWLEEAEAMGRCDRALAAGSSPLTYWHTVVSQYQPAQLHTNISPPVCPQCSRYKTGQQLGKQWDLAGNYNSSS